MALPARNVLILTALVILCAALAQTSPGHVVLRGMGLYEPPASYTALNFTTPNKLPSQLNSSNSAIAVSFGIHNVSGNARAYQWSVTLVEGGTSRVAASGAASVPAQGRVTVARTVTAACTAARVQVQVRLASPAESIEFWATCPVTAGAAK